MDTIQGARPLAVVTGASSGIGYELAIQFARNGHDLIIVSGSPAIHQAAAQLKDFNVEIWAMQHDLTQEAEVDAFCHHVRQTGRPIAALAINAGVGVGGRFWETDLCAEMDMIRLNVIATYHIAKHLVQYMIETGQGGRILFTSSVAGEVPSPYQAVYGATKAFDLSLALALRHELKDLGIQVTALQPGPTDTNFFHRAGMDDTKVNHAHKDDPADVARAAYEALMDDKDHVVPGAFMNKVLASDIVPDKAKIASHAELSKPGGARDKDD